MRRLSDPPEGLEKSGPLSPTADTAQRDQDQRQQDDKDGGGGDDDDCCC